MHVYCPGCGKAGMHSLPGPQMYACFKCRRCFQIFDTLEGVLDQEETVHLVGEEEEAQLEKEWRKGRGPGRKEGGAS